MISFIDERLFYMSQENLKEQKEQYAHNLPDDELLDPTSSCVNKPSSEKLEQLGSLIEEKLKEFDLHVAVKEIITGPVITRFLLQLAPGTRVKSIVNRTEDLAHSLEVKSINVIEVIPDTTYIGLEIPNAVRNTIHLKDLIERKEFKASRGDLTCALGCDIEGKPVYFDLEKMPHLIVAGTTGSGMSVGINSMILSMLFKSTPDDLRLVLIDSKKHDFATYDGIPHLLSEVITDLKLAPNALKWCIAEMDRRFDLIRAVKGVGDLLQFNKKVTKAIEEGTPILDPLSNGTYLNKLPRIVVVINELAELMVQDRKLVDEYITILAQKAHAVGIHMIIALQSPNVYLPTGLMRSNISSRIAFTLANYDQSYNILEELGAESLLGKGDMLFMPASAIYPKRVHGVYVSPEEIERIVSFWKLQRKPEYVQSILSDNY